MVSETGTRRPLPARCQQVRQALPRDDARSPMSEAVTPKPHLVRAAHAAICADIRDVAQTRASPPTPTTGGLISAVVGWYDETLGLPIPTATVRALALNSSSGARRGTHRHGVAG